MNDTLLETARHMLDKEGIRATRLCTHTEDVDHINDIHLNKLKGMGASFKLSYLAFVKDQSSTRMACFTPTRLPLELCHTVRAHKLFIITVILKFVFF